MMPIFQPPAGYPAHYFSMQPNLPPLPVKRELAADELALMAKGTQQWTGKWFPHLGTELWELMSDPKKQASLWGHLSGWSAGLVGGALGTMAHSTHYAATHLGAQSHQILSGPSVGLAALGALVGLPAAFLAHAAAEQNNGNLKDMWPRLPHRPTRRDYLSDPVANMVAPMRAVNAKDIAPQMLGNAATGMALAGLVAATSGRSSRSSGLFTRRGLPG